MPSHFAMSSLLEISQFTIDRLFCRLVFQVFPTNTPKFNNYDVLVLFFVWKDPGQIRMRFLSSSSILSLIVLSLHHAEVTAERLVIFAGPRKTSETSVEEFFYSYAHGPASAMSGFAHQEALKHWVWPQLHKIHGLLTTPHQIYGHLVTEADDKTLQDKILSELKEHYDKAKNVDGDNFQGIIIGSEEFDRVGPNPYSQDDAVFAVERVTDALGLTAADVTIVLLYRTPRLDQWLAIFEAVPFDEGEQSYQTLLCDDKYKKRYAWDLLQNAMSPLRVALIYAMQGYGVKMLDLTGLEKKGLDVEHVIGCEVLNAPCDDEGFLLNLRDESYLIDTAIHDSIQTDFAELTATQEADLERLFLLRDCAYDYLRTDTSSGVSWEYQTDDGLLSDGCTPTNIAMANKLINTDYFLNVLQSQVDCNDDPVSIKDIFLGTALDATLSPTDEMDNPPDSETNPAEDVDGTPQQGGDNVEPSELDSSVTLPNGDTIQHQASSSSSSSAIEEPKKRTLLYVFLALALGGIAFVVWKRRTKKRRNPRDLVNTPDFELQPSLEESVQDWTKTFD